MTHQQSESLTARRGFLKLTATSALGIAVLHYIEKLIPSNPPADAHAMRTAGGVLSATEFDTLAAVAHVLIGASAGQPGTHDARTAERVELELTKIQGRLASDVKAALKLVEYLPVFWGTGARLSRLPIERQYEMVDRMRLSDNLLIRSAYSGLRFLCVLFYYSDSRAWPRIGYAGPTVQAKFYEGGNRIVNLKPIQGV